jgi:hypothetical protein
MQKRQILIECQLTTAFPNAVHPLITLFTLMINSKKVSIKLQDKEKDQF